MAALDAPNDLPGRWARRHLRGLLRTQVARSFVRGRGDAHGLLPVGVLPPDAAHGPRRWRWDAEVDGRRWRLVGEADAQGRLTLTTLHERGLRPRRRPPCIRLSFPARVGLARLPAVGLRFPVRRRWFPQLGARASAPS